MNTSNLIKNWLEHPVKQELPVTNSMAVLGFESLQVPVLQTLPELSPTHGITA